MGLIINIDEALKNRADYNVFREPVNDMLTAQQEAWEKENPLDLLFVRGTIDRFAQTYTDSIGFSKAFAETGDYAVAPLFNNAGGFSATYTARTFQGCFTITQQVLEDGDRNAVKDVSSQFMTAWHRGQVEYGLKAIESGFGVAKKFGDDKTGYSHLELKSADTTDGVVTSETKNPLFCATHKTVAHDDVAAISQSNLFAVKDGDNYGINLAGDDPGKIAKLADVIDYVVTEMENYRDDNGQYAGVSGKKYIVAPNDSRLKAALRMALEDDKACGAMGNPALGRAEAKLTPYLRDMECCYDKTNRVAKGFFIVDPEYNKANHGPEFTERIPLTMNVDQTKNPYGISYDARQRFGINVASWRGIAFVYFGTAEPKFAKNGAGTDFTAINPVDTIVKPVSVAGTVNTKTTT